MALLGWLAWNQGALVGLRWVEFDYDAGALGPPQLLSALRAAGFSPRPGPAR